MPEGKMEILEPNRSIDYKSIRLYNNTKQRLIIRLEEKTETLTIAIIEGILQA